MRTRAGAAVAVPILLLGILLGGAARAHDYDELGALEKEAVDQVLRARRLEVEDHPEGKTIGAILVENLEVFSERDGCTLMWFNRFHATTRAGVIAREVLLRPGQVWDQERVDETRRGLRDPFLSNAVVLLPVKGARPETVDLLVVTRDVWSLRLSNNFEIQDGQLTLLLFSLTETNLFGWRKKLAFGFIMDQGSIEIGPAYIDRNIAGTRLTLTTSARAILSRADGSFAGTRSRSELAYPLWSLASKWGASVTVDHYDAPVAAYRGTGVRTWDNPDTAVEEMVPVVYHYRTVRARTSGVRSFGTTVKQLVSAGHELDLTRPSFLDGFLSDPVLRAAFARDRFGRDELASALFLRYRLFTPVFAALRDLETFDFREDLPLGPMVDLRAAAARTELGSDRDFGELSAAAQYGQTWRGGYARAAAAWSTRLEGGEAIDTLVQGELYAASPKLGRLGRVVASAEVGRYFDATANQGFTLGGDSGLRGYRIGAFPEVGLRGDTRVLTHVELRTLPLKIMWWRLGAVAFWDMGHAADFAALDLKHDIGLGVRTLIPQFDTIVFRLDAAVPLDGPTRGHPRLTLGAYQVF
jgi:hypothetical protein